MSDGAQMEGVGSSSPEVDAPPEQNAGPTPVGIRTIDVDIDDGETSRRVSVVIDSTGLGKKPYLGGLRNTKTERVYHHATCQTSPRSSGNEGERCELLCRETQTVDVRTKGTQSLREAGTQMDRPDLLLDKSGDREVVPGDYVTSGTVHENRVRAAIMIQRCARGAAARKRARHLKALKEERDLFLAEQENKRVREAELKRKHDIERRMYPRSKEDFDILHDELEAWRLKETGKIKEHTFHPDDQQIELAQLLYKETKLLQTIDRLRVTADHESKERKVRTMLGRMSEPQSWQLSNGKKVLVHTPFTTRAKQLSQLYFGASASLLTLEERLDVLLHIKWTVKEFDCDLTRQLVRLIDREADLLNRGRNPKTLEGLRKRICTLFLAFIETPEFNPEAEKMMISVEKPDSYVYATVGKATATTTLGRQTLYNTV